jgi:hypothetical protein
MDKTEKIVDLAFDASEAGMSKEQFKEKLFEEGGETA